MNRKEAQRLALEKLEDAELLLANGRCSSAYYLAGYSIELALKACIARKIKRETIPNKKFVNEIYTHKLTDLVRLADLSVSIDKMKRDQSFAANWAIVIKWNEEARYETTGFSSAQAHDLIAAIKDPKHGILVWLISHW